MAPKQAQIANLYSSKFYLGKKLKTAKNDQIW